MTKRCSFPANTECLQPDSSLFISLQKDVFILPGLCLLYHLAFVWRDLLPASLVEMSHDSTACCLLWDCNGSGGEEGRLKQRLDLRLCYNVLFLIKDWAWYFARCFRSFIRKFNRIVTTLGRSVIYLLEYIFSRNVKPIKYKSLNSLLIFC